MTIKSYLRISAAVIIIILAGMWYLEHNAKLRERSEKERLALNQEQLLKENASYQKITLTDDEFKKSITKRIDSLIKVAGTKPKYVTNVIERHYYHGDTSSHTVPTTPQVYDGYRVYSFTDTSSCFTIGGHVQTFLASDPLVTINKREFNNKSTSIGYIYRPNKFLFIKWGPWKADLQTFNTCGKEITKDLQILKKKRLQIKN